MTLSAQIAQAAADIAQAAAGTDAVQLADLVQELTLAGRIVTYGCGREGLMMRALTMRLYHLGLDAHVVGDMCCPPLSEGDLFLCASGLGNLSTVAALLGQARSAGARTACVTGEPGGPDPMGCDLVLTIPAQTMAGAQTALLPMGSVFEGAQFLIFEILVLTLRDRLLENADTMRARHTNME